ncbi:MAG: helix-turn-helix transcriptional regulator, partial [Chitinophagaceae bacterium]|nr:helix-turn-helix transcriptional regulator [Chitinophagaceae bacterium]
VLVVKQVLEKMNLEAHHVIIGEINFSKQPTEIQIHNLNSQLFELGFEILNDKNCKQIEKIKLLIIKRVQLIDLNEQISLSKYLSNALHKDYSYISRLFSSIEGISIEQYFIKQKIEKVKELLIYGNQNLSEISYRLKYSSVSHLSAQFKRVTGFTPSQFKELGNSQRKAIDLI